MSYTIFSKTGAFPVAIAGSKLVKTFPSGLVLVSQEYAVPRGQEDAYASTFAVGQPLPVESPAIDGLYIFPEPEWRDSGDGFTRLTVSAYGRWNSTGKKTMSKTLNEFGVIYGVFNNTTTGINTKTFPTTNDQLVWTFVVPKNSTPNVTTNDTLKVYRLNGLNASPFYLAEVFDRAAYNTANPLIQPIDSLSLSVEKKLTRAENINFGFWDEWTVVWEALPGPALNFGSYYLVTAPQRSETFQTTYNFETENFSNEFINLLNSNKIISGNSFEVKISKVENINTTAVSWNNSTQRTNIPKNTNTTTFRNGKMLWGDTSATYTPPVVSRPSGRPQSAGQTFEANGFTWRAVGDGSSPPTSESPGGPIYKWAFNTSYETFEITIQNERGMFSNFPVVVEFEDSRHPDVQT